jgi:uncharacterized damage-inducible protein DinB
MLVRIGLEEAFEGRSLAWAIDHPGCFAYGEDGNSAVVAMARAIPDYIAWMERHTPRPWFAPAEIDIRLVEVCEDYRVDDFYQRADEGTLINAWFQNDWQPLTVEDTRRGAQLFEWSRAELLEAFQQTPPQEVDAERPGERWSIRGLLAHVGTSQWWLLDRLGLAGIPRSALPKEPQERAEAMYTRMASLIPTLAGVEQVVGRAGEFWSPRKLLRRSIWHQRDHAAHIRSLTAGKV